MGPHQGLSITFVEEDLKSMVDSMCVAAERRVEGILGNSRRRQYGRAAMLVASCVALAPAAGGKDLSAWMMGLRQTYSRRHAFREEFRQAWRAWRPRLSDTDAHARGCKLKDHAASRR